MTPKGWLFLLTALGLAAVGGTAPSSAQTYKIGVFDAQKVTQETAEGARIQARLRALNDRKQADLKKLEEEIQKLKDEFIQNATSLSEDKKREMTLRIQRKEDDLDSAKKAASREMQIEVENAQETWQRRVVSAVVAYGKEKGFSLILHVDAALYFDSAIDITEDVVKVIDAQTAPAAAKPPEKPAEKAPGK